MTKLVCEKCGNDDQEKFVGMVDYVGQSPDNPAISDHVKWIGLQCSVCGNVIESPQNEDRTPTSS